MRSKRDKIIEFIKREGGELLSEPGFHIQIFSFPKEKLIVKVDSKNTKR